MHIPKLEYCSITVDSFSLGNFSIVVYFGSIIILIISPYLQRMVGDHSLSELAKQIVVTSKGTAENLINGKVEVRAHYSMDCEKRF